jgi:glycerophosphoryl diester phosphodiesterase
LDLLKRYPAIKGLVISSFLPEVVGKLHELGAEFDLGLICENEKQLSRWTRLPIHALMLHSSLVNEKWVRVLHDASKQLFVWTVNSAREMKKFAEMGVDGIISDDTKLLVQTLRPDLAGRATHR